MALSRIKTWIAGDILTAADLNAEFNNILNNPVTLVSPTTAAINFDNKAHTNLPANAISATSGTDGQILTNSSAGATIWKAPSGTNPTIPLVAGAAVFSSSLFPQLLKSTVLNTDPSMVLGYASTGMEKAYWSVPLSTNISAISSASLDLWYFATSSASKVWQVGTNFIISASSGGGKTTSVSSTSTPETSGVLNKVSIALVATSWATPGVLQMYIGLFTSDAGSSGAGDAYLHSAALRITV